MERIPQLDILRAVAIILVIGRHYSPFAILNRCGWIGVDLFFVLSGFLISGLLFTEIKKKGGISVGRFLVRRGFKIYPPYFFYLAISLMIDRPIRWTLYLNQALFLQNYLSSRWAHTWSLAVEEHFYITLPLLLLMLLHYRKLSWMPVICVVCTVACLSFRIWMSARGYSATAVGFSTHTRFDSLLCGVGIGYLFHFKRELFNRLSVVWLPLPAAILMIPSLTLDANSRFMLTGGLLCNTLAFSCLLVWFVNRPSRIQLMEQIGQNSYSIYLWQFAVEPFLSFVPTSIGQLLFAYCGAICIGVTMAQVVEFPALALREKLFPVQKHRNPMQAGKPAPRGSREAAF